MYELANHEDKKTNKGKKTKEMPKVNLNQFSNSRKLRS